MSNTLCECVCVCAWMSNDICMCEHICLILWVFMCVYVHICLVVLRISPSVFIYIYIYIYIYIHANMKKTTFSVDDFHLFILFTSFILIYSIHICAFTYRWIYIFTYISLSSLTPPSLFLCLFLFLSLSSACLCEWKKMTQTCVNKFYDFVINLNQFQP